MTASVPDGSPTNPGKVDPPMLDAILDSTVYDSVPVHGTAPKGSRVLFESDNGDTATQQVDTNGRFCVDAPLAPGEQNQFHVTSIDSYGNQSTKVDFAVSQSGQPEQAPASAKSENAALTGKAKSYRLGIFSQDDHNTIDGDVGTSMEAELTGVSGVGPSVVATFAAPARIDRIEAIAPGDCLFVKPMKLYWTMKDAATSPVVDAAGWNEVPVTVSSDQLRATAKIPSTVATGIAVVWPRDGIDVGNCGGWSTSGVAWYGLSELQAWTVPNVAPPAPRTPSCSGSN